MAQKLIVPKDQSGKKLEKFLASKFPIGYVRKLFRKNGVRVNGKRAKAPDLIQTGDRLEFYVPFVASRGDRPNAERPEVGILFENSELLIINKPPGLIVHETKSVAKRRTLLGLLESRYRDASFKPRLVHRLDKDTSGVLLTAKAEDVAQELAVSFEEGKVEKEYLCLLAGKLWQNVDAIDFPLPGRQGKQVSAVTHFRVEKRFFDTTFVRVTMETGRMHQIRLHFAKLGYPVVLDSQHGDFKFNKSFRKRFGLRRQFLHAARLSIVYRGRKFIWSAPLPDDLERTLQALAAAQHGWLKI